jgi:hypothetical protein
MRPTGQCSGGKYRQDYPDGTFSGCGRWLTASDFESHRVQRDGQPDYARRCLTDEELLERGWVRHDDGSWASPRRIAKAAEVQARLRPSDGSGDKAAVTKEASA